MKDFTEDPEENLDLYETLKSYPKDKSMQVMEDDPQSLRQQGRMKNKKLVIEKQQTSHQGSEEVADREVKRPKKAES